MNPAFDQENINNINNNNIKINTNESIKINSSSINNNNIKFGGAQYTVIPQSKLSPIEKCEEGSCSFDNKKFSEKKNRVSNYKNCTSSKGIYVPFTESATQSAFNSKYILRNRL